MVLCELSDFTIILTYSLGLPALCLFFGLKVLVCRGAWTLSPNTLLDISASAVDESTSPPFCSISFNSHHIAKRSLRPITSLPSDLEVGNSATAIGLFHTYSCYRHFTIFAICRASPKPG